MVYSSSDYKLHEHRDLECFVYNCIPGAQHSGPGLKLEFKKRVEWMEVWVSGGWICLLQVVVKIREGGCQAPNAASGSPGYWTKGSCCYWHLWMSPRRQERLSPKNLSIFLGSEHIRCNSIYHLPEGFCKIPAITLHLYQLTPLAAHPLQQTGPCRVHWAAIDFHSSKFCTLPEGFIPLPEIAREVGWVKPRPTIRDVLILQVSFRESPLSVGAKWNMPKSDSC